MVKGICADCSVILIFLEIGWIQDFQVALQCLTLCITETRIPLLFLSVSVWTDIAKTISSESRPDMEKLDGQKRRFKWTKDIKILLQYLLKLSFSRK